MAKSQATLVGAEELKRDLHRFSTPKNAHDVYVGIVETAKYPTGTLQGRPDRKNPPYVAEVAFWNEFGTKGGGWGGPIPERPFMRIAIEKAKEDKRIDLLLKHAIDPTNPTISKQAAEVLGNIMKGLMQEQGIHSPTHKPNAPATVDIKTKGAGGNTTPLIDEDA